MNPQEVLNATQEIAGKGAEFYATGLALITLVVFVVVIKWLVTQLTLQREASERIHNKLIDFYAQDHTTMIKVIEEMGGVMERVNVTLQQINLRQQAEDIIKKQKDIV